MRIIDSHCLFGVWPKEPRDVSLPTLLKVLDKLGIDKGVCVSLRGVFLDHEKGNTETLRVCGQHPQLVPAATINPLAYYSPESLPAELVKQGFRMLRLFPREQGWTAQNVVVERILAECTETGLPVAFSIGKFADVGSAIGRIAPKGCRVILSDLYYNAMTECLEVLRRRSEFMMEMGHTCSPGAVELLCRQIGAGRLILGTNQPLEVGRGAIEEVLHADISEKDKTAILGGNLSALLGGI
jgi:predicted TIM-barrel fold metal-dependent hydrolase